MFNFNLKVHQKSFVGRAPPGPAVGGRDGRKGGEEGKGRKGRVGKGEGNGEEKGSGGEGSPHTNPNLLPAQLNVIIRYRHIA